MRYWLLVMLSLAVVASGCIGGGQNNEDEEDAPATAVLCSQMELEILQGNGDEVQVINLGDSSFGNITVKWQYSGDRTVTKEVETPGARERITYESGRTGMMERVSVQHNSCPSRNAIQY
jgi:hypothetical protein